mmetsp:Transcript_4345/g.11249  ORF Transcript_4345/g.11249 Transcript_4345/m.11249 type:complete len:189 (-) Transcript_4345:158-724(-)
MCVTFETAKYSFEMILIHQSKTLEPSTSFNQRIEFILSRYVVYFFSFLFWAYAKAQAGTVIPHFSGSSILVNRELTVLYKKVELPSHPKKRNFVFESLFFIMTMIVYRYSVSRILQSPGTKYARFGIRSAQLSVKKCQFERSAFYIASRLSRYFSFDELTPKNVFFSRMIFSKGGIIEHVEEIQIPFL